MKLNNLSNKHKKIRPGRGFGSGKVKLLEEDIKDKNLDSSCYKVLREVKCLYIEDFQEDLKLYIKIK